MKKPFYIKCEHGGVRVGVEAFHHQDGGICFFDVGWDSSMGGVPPFHILNGPFVAKETPSGRIYEAENGDIVRELTQEDPVWIEWQQWGNYLNAPDCPDTTSDETAISGCKNNGALIDKAM